jgi:hypothetical protein
VDADIEIKGCTILSCMILWYILAVGLYVVKRNIHKCTVPKLHQC